MKLEAQACLYLLREKSVKAGGSNLNAGGRETNPVSRF